MAPLTALSRLAPITVWWSESSPGIDILAGIALAGLLIPQAMAYAGIAGVPPQMGLYAALSGLFVYAIFGTSRQLAVSATSSSAAMLAALVTPMVAGDPSRYTVLASAAAVAVGLILLAGGLLRLGSASEFISKPVLKGFVFGLALTIILKQGHNFLGISGTKGNFFHQAWHVITSVREVNLWTLVLGASALALMYLLAAVAPRVPSALVALVLSTVAVSWFHLQQRGVEVVGTMHAGMPSLSWPKLSEDEAADVFVGAIGIALVLMAEALAAGRIFAAKHKYDISPNQELCALGCANVASGLIGGIVVGGGMSGTAANDSIGARTQLSTIVASLSVGLTLAFLLPAIRNLPQAVLAAIVIKAVAHLADVSTLRYYVRLRTESIWGFSVALVAVLQTGILKGLIFAVALTLVVLMGKLSKPQDSVLGELNDTGDFVDIARYPNATQVPGLLIFRPNGMLFFANATRIQNRVRELVKRTETSVHAVVLNLEASPEIDVTTLDMLQELRNELRCMGKELWFARLADPVHELFQRSGFLEVLGQEAVYGEVDAAADAFLHKSYPAPEALGA